MLVSFSLCKWFFFHQLYKLETFLFVVILPAVKRGNDGHFNCASWELSWPLQHLQWRWWHTNAPPSNMCASIDERISRRALGDDRTSSLRLLQNYRWCLPFPPILRNHHHHHRGSFHALSSGLQAEKVLLLLIYLFILSLFSLSPYSKLAN
jgi:hypothetical protein